RPTWADALLAMADRCLGAEATTRPHWARHLVVVHLRGDDDGARAHLHGGPPLPDALRRLLGCDGRVRPLVEVGGAALSVGRTQRIVPERTRMAVEERDGSCRVPGCERTRRLQVHHVTHWEDGGGTDTANLVALCSRHHRLHHLGRLGIEGHADDPEGMVFSDTSGRRLTGCGRPAPPEGITITGSWSHPSGERLDPRWVHFREPTPAA
nr:HNH endonuclease [Actinomycetota bacterium]